MRSTGPSATFSVAGGSPSITWLDGLPGSNQLTGAAQLGSVGLDWQLGGFAVDSSTASMGGSSQVGQLVRAMAGFGGGSVAADSMSSAVGADTSQQPLLTTPQHA